MHDFQGNIDSWVHKEENDRFFSKKYLTSIWNSIWQDWVFGIWGQIQILWKYLVFEVKYKYLKVFGIPNTLKVFNPALFDNMDTIDSNHDEEL